MSRLHNPGPGELWDRLTILALKTTHAILVKRETHHWEAERDALVPQWGAVTGDLSRQPVLVEQLLELAAVNGALWQAEDQLRQLRAQIQVGPPFEVAKCYSQAGTIGLQITQLNDRRATLVSLINMNTTGVADAPNEKL